MSSPRSHVGSFCFIFESTCLLPACFSLSNGTLLAFITVGFLLLFFQRYSLAFITVRFLLLFFQRYSLVGDYRWFLTSLLTTVRFLPRLPLDSHFSLPTVRFLPRLPLVSHFSLPTVHPRLIYDTFVPLKHHIFSTTVILLFFVPSYSLFT